MGYGLRASAGRATSDLFEDLAPAMLIIAAFWLVMVLPGLALLRRLRSPWLAYGLPSSVTLSYLTTFALLSPISIAGYIFRLPLWVLSAAVLAFAALAAGWLASHERRLRQRVRARVRWWTLLGSLLICVDAVLGLRSGANTSGDATYHMSRVRMLLDFGFNNWDPLASGHHFDTVYHTNLFHALLASSAQLARVDAPDAWVHSWFFTKLITPGAIYLLAFVLLRRRWLAWMAAIMFCVWQTSSSLLSYPNTLAAFTVFPLGLAFAIEALSGNARRWTAVGLGLVALIAIQIHGLYYLLCCCVLVPALLLRLSDSTLRRRPGQRRLLVCLLALGVGTPWVAVTAVQRHLSFGTSPADPTAQADSAPAAAAASTSDGETASESETTGEPSGAVELDGLDRGFLRFPDGALMLEPNLVFDWRDTRLQLLAALAAGLCSRRRRRFAALGAMLVTLCVILYVPPVCTLFAKLLGAPWIVKRFVIVHEIMHDAICPGAYLLLVPLRFAGTLLRVFALALALAHGWYDGVNYEPWTHKRHFHRALGHGRAAYLALHRARREHLLKTVEPGQTVVTPLSLAAPLVVDCPCYPLALPKAGRGVEDMEQRRLDTVALLAPGGLDLPSRIGRMKHYGVRYLVLRQGVGETAALRRLYKPIIHRQRALAGVAVFELDLDRPLPADAPEQPSATDVLDQAPPP